VRGALHAQDGVALLAALHRGTAREVLQPASDRAPQRTATTATASRPVNG
jgi:hypothetical protein